MGEAANESSACTLLLRMGHSAWNSPFEPLGEKGVGSADDAV